jgi:hypothetical protein
MNPEWPKSLIQSKSSVPCPLAAFATQRRSLALALATVAVFVTIGMRGARAWAG